MESDLQQYPSMFLDHQHQQQVNSGLTRYRSAPSSYFSNIIDKDFYEHIFNRPSSPETERVFARFLNSLSGDGAADDSLSQNLSPPARQSAVVKEEIINQLAQDIPSMSNEPVVLQQQKQQSNISDYSSPAPQNLYQSSGRPPLPTQMRTGRGNHSNLIRHGSSPAGLFASINIDSGYAAMRGRGTFGADDNTNSQDQANFSPAVRLKNNPPNYSSGLSSSRAEIEEKINRESNPDREAFGESHSNDFIPGLPVGPWDDSSFMSMTGLKRYRDDDTKPFSGINATETQNETTGGGQASSSTPLADQLSLPNTSAEMAAIEKFLSDSVPCKIRAKRGCATHPRSIAERVRRTKISERMRKLQDLVPNMDKQTNTADMLDLAVEYIKDLQKQVLTLSDYHANCTCSHKQQQ